MEKRANIVAGPGHFDFLFMLPFYSCKQGLAKKFFFLVDHPWDMPGDPKVMLLTIKKVNENGSVGEWNFEGEAGSRLFKGFLSTNTGSGWIEAAENSTNNAISESADGGMKIMKGD